MKTTQVFNVGSEGLENVYVNMIFNQKNHFREIGMNQRSRSRGQTGVVRPVAKEPW